MEQLSIFDMLYEEYKIKKKIRLIELFAGVGSQAMALRNLGALFEHYRVVEFDKYAMASYNAIHGTNFECTDIKEVKGADLGIVDKNNYCYLLTYSFPCGLPGTKIKVADGYKNIEDVCVGDEVMTHNNRYNKVSKVMTRISPDYYSIRVLGYPELKITSEHPMYVLRGDKIQWVKVKDLTLSDKVCFNVNVNSIHTKCSDKVLWMLGRYVADGHINKYTYNSINFSIAFKKEEEFIDHIPDEMQGKFRKFKKACWDYRIADADFQELCEECGIGATNKRVPQWVQDLPAEQAKHFLDGYLAGDGHKRTDRGNNELIMFSTTSKELFLGIQNLIMKVYGVVCSCYKRTDSRKDTYNDSYNGQFSVSAKSFVQTRIENHIFTPIREIKYIDKQTSVYNFEVEQDNSYTMENIVVHNCTDLSVAGRQAGMAKGSGTRSGLLWEVERLLDECEELPQVLLMENVDAVHNDLNREHFYDWISFLEKKGYSNYWKDMNGADYGVAQHRVRTFMVSILGNYNFRFPAEIPLNMVMADYLEDTVDERYYVNSEKALSLIKDLEAKGQLESISNTVRGGGRGSIDRHQWDMTLTK